METKRSAKKLRASIVAGTLAVAMALTGTLAWRSISQKMINEFMVQDKNPGARLHDDFDGKNKDIYVENFTDPGTGAAIFARVRLDEYMETGEDSGVNRDAAVRAATPKVPGADLNNPATWKTHIPNDDTDPFHDFWVWELGGSTVFMPTFNKNKDSLSVDVNGTYVGADGKWDTGTPYDDYTEYTSGQEKTADAYYDKDKDEDDEYTGAAGTLPGGGGVEGDDYTKVEEKHTAKSTRNATVLTMDQWKGMGSPVGDFWVWDTDGWAYWAAPIQPGEATGLLLTGVKETKAIPEKCYYAINVIGQFATAKDWGDAVGDDGNPSGFYIDGFTDDAKALLDKAASMVPGENGKWYVDLGHNVYQEVDSSTGAVGQKVCAGMDKTPGTTDDKTNVLILDTDLRIGDKDYGNHFLTPVGDQIYYLAVGTDGLLGTTDDVRIWHTGGADFPGGTNSTTGATGVTVTAEGGVTEYPAGGTLKFTASVATDTGNQAVKWSVSGGSGSSRISGDGTLTIAYTETEGTTLTVKAVSVADDRAEGTYDVKVLAQNAITVAVTSNYDTVAAADQLQFKATVKKGTETVAPDSVTWSAKVDDNVFTKTGIDASSGLLTVESDVSAGTKIVVRADVTVGGTTGHGTKTVTVTAPGTVNVTVSAQGGATQVSAGGTLKFNAYANKVLTDKTFDWSVVEPSDGSVTVSGGAITVGDTVKAGTKITVKATSRDSATHNPSGTASVTVKGPSGVVLSGGVTELKKGQTAATAFTATVKDGSANYPSQKVNWVVSGNNDTETTLVDGVLTIGADETAKTITVTVNSQVDTSKSASEDVIVKSLNNVKVGDVVAYDNIEFKVLALDDTKGALVVSQDVLCERRMDPTDTTHYHESELHKWLNNDWLNSLPELKAIANTTTIYTRTQCLEHTLDQTDCKVFLLSLPDVCGEYGGEEIVPKEFTAGKQLFFNNEDRVAKFNDKDATYWLRSPGHNSNFSYAVYPSGEPRGDVMVSPSRKNTLGVRPALWISI